MKVCSQVLKGTQIFDTDGSVRLCCWMKSEFANVGKLSEKTIDEIWHGEKTRALIEKLSKGDYSCCDDRNCAFLTAGKTPPLVEIDEIPEHVTNLAIGYENICNQRCSVCPQVKSHDFNCLGDEVIAKQKKIEKNLESVLPHLKWISANGCGELFCSNSALKLLSNWKPIAPPEEVGVHLETNGSMFNEQNWKKIENIGQYNLSVTITVMSFEEPVYQILTGVKWPVSRIENNLRFVKSLREKGIINNFQITTVVQERNFRTLPTFFKRCVEEFGADSVRFRAYVPFGCYDRDVEWFTDIRNKNHPYHKEYMEILKNPVFKSPKLVDWGIWHEHETPSPFQKERKLRQQENKILKEIFSNPAIFDKLENELLDGKKEVIVNGAGALGLTIAKALTDRGNVQVKRIIDYMQKGDFLNVPIIAPKDDCENKDLPVIMTWLQTKFHDYDYIRSLGYTGKFIKLEEIFDFDKLFKEDCDCCK